MSVQLYKGYFETSRKRISEAEEVVLRKQNENAAANDAQCNTTQ